jgi:hypothetical protein
MKLCQKCIDEIKLATNTIWPFDFFEVVKDVECEQWAHKELNRREHLEKWGSQLKEKFHIGSD